MDEELAALERNNIFGLVPRPQGRKIIGSKWAYKNKRLADGSVERLKARGVANGYSKPPVHDYAVMNPYAHNSWDPRQFDVKSAFLYGELSEAPRVRSG